MLGDLGLYYFLLDDVRQLIMIWVVKQFQMLLNCCGSFNLTNKLQYK